MTPKPEELQTETTPAIETELDRAARDFYQSVEYAESDRVDWRKVKDTEPDD